MYYYDTNTVTNRNHYEQNIRFYNLYVAYNLYLHYSFLSQENISDDAYHVNKKGC